ncbi:E3 ubiquitin ligase, partial [Kappamyces sp. JEL0680]
WTLKKQWRFLSRLKDDPASNILVLKYLKKLRKRYKRYKADRRALQKSAAESVLQRFHEQERKLVTCQICTDFLSVPVAAECGHVYCYFCLCKWIAQLEHNGTCPLCRKKLLGKPYISLSTQSHVENFVESLSSETRTAATGRIEAEKSRFRQLEDPWASWHRTDKELIEDAGDMVSRYALVTNRSQLSVLRLGGH